VAELRFVTRVKAFIGRRAIAFGRKAVLDAKVMVKSIGPKTGAKSRTSEHGAEGVANCLVSPFDGTVLVGRVGASGVHGIAKFLKERDDEGVAVEFPALVEDDILIGHVRRVFRKPMSKPVEGRALGDTCGTGQKRSGVVSNK
jgi:hypothetical protein